MRLKEKQNIEKPKKKECVILEDNIPLTKEEIKRITDELEKKY